MRLPVDADGNVIVPKQGEATVPESASAIDDANVENKHEEKRFVSSVDFPYSDLADAIEVVQAIHELGGGALPEQLCAKLSYSNTDNGSYRNKVSASRKFGLTTWDRDGRLTLTELSNRILIPETSDQAKIEAFLNVELFKKIYERYRGQLLPPDQGLENVVVQLGVSPKQKAKARQVLQKSARVAGFFNAGSNKLVMPTVVTRNSGPAASFNAGAEGGNTDLAMLTKRLEELERENEKLRQNGNMYLPGELPQAIIGVLTTLPLSEDDKWTTEDLDDWTSMFKTVIKRAFRTRIESSTGK